MADAKIITYGELISATTDVIPDNQAVALAVQSSDGNDVLTVDTRDGAEVTQLSAAGTDVFRISNSGCLVENGTLTLGSGAILYHQGTGADTATTQAVYLPSGSSGAKIIVDFANGNVGDITLTAAVTSIDFYNVPADGTCATVTARITQDSSTRTIDYSDSAVTCYSDGGSSAVTGEIKFSGGVHHTQSTGSGEVDVISFTSIPTGSTFNIYAAVIGQDFS